MQSFLCRVMTIVFVLNCLLSTPSVWAQYPLQKFKLMTPEEIQQSLEKNLENKKKSESALTELVAEFQKATESYENANTMNEVVESVKWMHAIAHAIDEESDRIENLDKQKEELQKRNSPLGNLPPTQPLPLDGQRAQIQVKMDTMRMVAEEQARLNARVKLDTEGGNRVLELIKSPDFTFDQLVEEIDPVGARGRGGLLATAYAAEVFGNTIDTMDPSSLDEESMGNILDLLLRVQCRMFYRLDTIIKNNRYPTSVNDVMARGSLRITLWKIHEFYEEIGMKDPFTSYLEGKAKESTILPPQHTYQQVELTPVQKRLNAISNVLSGPANEIEQDPYAILKDDFLSELQLFKSHETTSDSVDFQLLLITANYATMFFLLSNKEHPKRIVKMFDTGDKKQNFEQPYSELFYQVMQSIYQTAKYSKGGNPNRAMSLFAEMTDPEKYSLPVRIFALEGAGKMLSSCQNFLPTEEGVFFCNDLQLDPEIRASLAARTVDLYVPLISTHYLAVNDYGLDSEQMKELSDQLVSIYNSFANDELKIKVTGTISCTNPRNNIQILNSGTSIPRISHSSGGHQFSCVKYGGEEDLVTIGGFGRDSKGNWHQMECNNNYNRKKVEDEHVAIFARIIGEALLWYVGGELIGMAYRATKGTFLAIGPMAKAAKTARWGRKAQAARVALTKSIRYQNIAHNLQTTGMTLVYTVEQAKNTATAATAAKTTVKGTELVAKAGKELALIGEGAGTAATGVVSNTTTKVITSMRQLRHRKFLQFLRKPNQGITKIEIFTHNRGLQFNGALASERAMSRLQNGINDYWDWKLFTNNLVDVAGNKVLWRDLNKVSSWWNPAASLTDPVLQQINRENELLLGTYRGLNQGKFNYWAHTKDGWARVDAATFGKMGKEIKAAEAAVPDYYAVLGVKPTATASDELKAAYRRLATKWHPDKPTGNPQKMAELNEAWGVLGDDTKRLAYNAKFKAQGSVAAQNTFGLTQAENGFSLAITRDLGNPKLFTGKGFDPVKTYEGLGFNAANWSENYAYQLTGHLATTGQLDVLGHNLITSTQFWRGFTGNAAFFTVWSGLDAAIYYLGFKDWMFKEQIADHQEEMDKYGDTFKPKEKPTTEQEEPIDNGLEIYSAVTNKAKDNSEGYLLIAPVIWARRGLASIGVGEMSFISDKDKALYKWLANNINLNKAIEEGAENKVKQANSSLYDMVMKVTGDYYQELEFSLGFLPDAPQLLSEWAAGYKKEIQTIYESADSSFAKYEKMIKSMEKWDDKFANLQLQNYYFFTKTYSSTEEIKLALGELWYYLEVPQIKQFVEKWQTDFNKEADKIYKSSKTNTEKLEELLQVIDKYDKNLDTFLKEDADTYALEYALSFEQPASFEELMNEYKDRVEFTLDLASEHYPENGKKIVGEITTKFIQQVDVLANSDMTEEKKKQELKNLYEEYKDSLYVCESQLLEESYMTDDENNEFETENYSLDELLPPSETEISTQVY